MLGSSVRCPLGLVSSKLCYASHRQVATSWPWKVTRTVSCNIADPVVCIPVVGAISGEMSAFKSSEGAKNNRRSQAVAGHERNVLICGHRSFAATRGGGRGEWPVDSRGRQHPRCEGPFDVTATVARARASWLEIVTRGESMLGKSMSLHVSGFQDLTCSPGKNHEHSYRWTKSTLSRGDSTGENSLNPVLVRPAIPPWTWFRSRRSKVISEKILNDRELGSAKQCATVRRSLQLIGLTSLFKKTKTKPRSLESTCLKHSLAF